jgi:hypothetical protein
MTVPLMLIFAWPYFYFCKLYGVDSIIALVGSFMFAIPFMITILHGHVTMALGTAHRKYYYTWIQQHLLSFGLLFHPVLISTRFRLILFIISILLIPVGLLLT